MINDNDRYMITGFNIVSRDIMIWSNDDEGLTKQNILALYAKLIKDENLISVIVSKIMPVVKVTLYDFKND